MPTIKTQMRHAFENIKISRKVIGKKEAERIGGMILDSIQHGAGVVKVLGIKPDAIIASPAPNDAPRALEGVGLA